MAATAKRPTDFLIAPSLLSCDFSRLGEEIRAVEAAGADWIHIDVMDGHFVPNLTLGPPVIRCLRPVTRLPLDVHLMIEQPERYVDGFIEAGADYLTIHVESTRHVKSTLEHIRKAKVKPGITLRPGTPIADVFPYLPLVDLVLVMTVEPGFGGQSFLVEQVGKITRLRQELARLQSTALIEVDGGINETTARDVRHADVLVAGSYIFKNDYKRAIQTLKEGKWGT